MEFGAGADEAEGTVVAVAGAYTLGQHLVQVTVDEQLVVVQVRDALPPRRPSPIMHKFNPTPTPHPACSCASLLSPLPPVAACLPAIRLRMATH